MGAEFRYICSKCGYSIVTSGPWEFYRDRLGNRRPAGHPVPLFCLEGPGIFGLSGEVYCPTCDEVFDVVLVEFKEPTLDTYAVWSGQCEPTEEFKKKDAVRCPQCGNPHLILGPDEETKTRCPRCQNGVLKGRVEWIS